MRIRTWVAIFGGMGLCGSVWASGFALLEQNASGLGNAYAGQAASAQDASTVFYNPAGLLRIEGEQVAAAGHLIDTSAKFTNDGSTLAALGPGGDAGGLTFLPNFYYAGDLKPGLKWGVGVGALFGLKSEYATPWAGQTHGVTSHLKTINVNPSLAWLYNDKVSVGVGINYQKAEVILSGSATAPAVNVLKMTGEDDAWGYNLGVLFKLDNSTRLGMSYRSEIKYRLDGRASGPVTGSISAGLTTPASASLALFSRLNDRWDLLADLSWSGWSSFDKLAVSGAVNTLVPENWNDTLRVALGANYRQNDKWLWRVGTAYDQSPVPDAAHRTVRMPDADRIWLAFGGQYKFSDKRWIDFGYAHLFFNDAAIDHVEAPIRVKGRYENRINIVSAQYTHTF